MKRYAIFHDISGGCHLVSVAFEEGTDPQKALEEAEREAEKNGYRGWNYDIPAKILAKHGLKIRPVDAIKINTSWLDPDDDPIRLCTCSECSSYEVGSCYRYGGIANGFEDLGVRDCIHCTGGMKLAFEGEEVTSYVFHTELEPHEVMKALLGTTEETFIPLREELRDFINDNWEEDGDIPEDGWSFLFDN